MKILLRWLAFGAVAFAVLAAGALVYLRRAYPPEKLRALAIAKVEPLIGRKLRIHSASLGLRGLDLAGLEVSEAPDFSAGKFLTAERVSAGWGLRALLERRLAISELRVAGFDCRYSAAAGAPSSPPGKKAKGAPAPSAPSAAAPKEPAEGRGGFAVTVSRVTLADGAIHYQDASGTSAKLKDVSGEVSGIGTSAELPASIAFHYVVDRPGARYAGKAKAEGTVKTGEAIEATFAPLELTLDNTRLTWKGRVRVSKGNVEATLAPLELAQGGLRLVLEGLLTRASTGAIKLSAKGRLPALSAEDLKRLGATSAALALPMGTAELELAYAGDRLTLAPAIVTLGPAKLEARGSAAIGKWKEGTRLDLALKTSGVPLVALAPLVPALSQYAVLGSADLDLKVTGRSDAPVLAGKGKISTLAANVNGFALSGGEVKLSFDPKNAKAAITGKLAGADLALDVDAKDYASAPDVRIDGRLATLDLTAWAARPAPPPEPPTKSPGKESGEIEAAQGGSAAPQPGSKPAKTQPKPISTSGKLALGPIKHPNFQAESAAFEWDLRGITPDLAELHGKTTLRVGKGRFDKLEAMAAKSQIVKVALFPFLVLQKTAGLVKLPLFPAFDKVSFSEIAGDYLFVKGVMTVKESHMDSSAGYVTTTGTADLARDKLDLRIALKAGGLLRGAVSGPLAFFVRGSLSNPEVKPDVAAIIKQPGVEQVIDQGKKLLQGIFK